MTDGFVRCLCLEVNSAEFLTRQLEYAGTSDGDPPHRCRARFVWVSASPRPWKI